MTESLDGVALLDEGDLRAAETLGSLDVLVGVCAVNQARSAPRVMAAALKALRTALAGRKGAVVAVEAGFRHETLDAIRNWLATEGAGAPVRCVRVAGAPSRSQALRAALAIADRLGSSCCALVDAGLVSASPEGLGRLVEPILDGRADRARPVYTHTAAEGTLTTNVLAPLYRALYGRRAQQLLGGCLALSGQVVTRLVEAEVWEGDLTDHGLEIRLAIDAAVSGDRVVEVHQGRKVLDAGLAQPDVPTTLVRTVGPFFRLMDRYRASWADVRGSSAVDRIGEPPALVTETGEIQAERMVRAFRLGLKDLLPLWEQALQEETLAFVYPLGILSPEEFAFPAEHWARVVYDFAVAFHEQRLPRDHLLRALTPLYLGRVAAFLRETAAAPPARLGTILEAVGRAFESEKTGLVARWR